MKTKEQGSRMSRRKFLGLAAVAASSLATLAAAPRTGSRPLSDQEKKDLKNAWSTFKNKSTQPKVKGFESSHGKVEGVSDLVDNTVLEEGLVLPKDWVKTPEEAAAIFGGKAEYWRQDVYINEKGEKKWGGAWVLEAFDKRTDGGTNEDGTNYDYTKPPKYTTISLGKFEEKGTAYATFWNGKENTYGTSSHSPTMAVEQAVVRPVPEDSVNCPTPELQRALAARGAMTDLFKFLNNDPNVDKVNVALSRPDGWKTFKPGELPIVQLGENFVPSENTPLNPKEAAQQYGGNDYNWSLDVYNGNTWDGTFIYEGFNLKPGLAARPDGLYLNRNGQPIPMDQIYDFSGPVSRSTITLPDNQTRLTFWDGGEDQIYGAGAGPLQTPFAVEQAVVRATPTGEFCSDPFQANPSAKYGVAADVRGFLTNDPHVADINVALWQGQQWTQYAPGALDPNNLPGFLQ
ncbi:hypothetical protein A3A93_04360 [Candidatus Roizmanbacteria bacterium RIFCSPLOWO2_01_FULL_38_12]|uniref:Uncharacterized protein n=1 Tax=Candidatus Roizmanbacteria bacterium RIFCSPLOWO2_01_FULL_38_12 TaxID=1802061 RepID=A0A1F7IXB6_9BACT|nr:MAG: hypothetical protein A2861_01135 [Candidatus Roizmanbacteria bacterium RIFCSPHIGHO2_01_FULL_38_15]OGK35473.1 MAG: hypothetical protein A3F59_00865 [Candidatus Roizmanbacteria bacterium RIFCSPHIGHO2_12_FULL_38_13]OGK48006.1 MAG: hypothetical protein A3A93_04360 [Candidatus Roizmanbacteria bacterium RIFCSPLOWO2_01_FULL_38_12]